MPHLLKSELERRLGPTMEAIADYRAARGYRAVRGTSRKMLWEITRVIMGLPDDPSAVGWLQSAGPDETEPVIQGYRRLCSELDQPHPEADAICLARLAVSAATSRIAFCRFAEWWFNGTHDLAHLTTHSAPPPIHDGPSGRTA